MILGNLLPNWMFQPIILLTSKVCVYNWTTYRFCSRLEKKKNIFTLCKMLPETWMNIKGLWPLWPQMESKVRHKILDCVPPSPLCDSVFVFQPSSTRPEQSFSLVSSLMPMLLWPTFMSHHHTVISTPCQLRLISFICIQLQK